MPVAVGFGVSRAEHVQAIGQYADGAVVGSALMRLVEEHGSDPGLPARLEAFARELTTPAEAPQ